MTSRERVLTTFDHKQPDRVPVWLGASPEFMAKAREYFGVATDEEALVKFGDDFRRVLPKYNGPDFPLSEGATCRSVFGIERHGYGYGQPLTPAPLKGATLEEVEAYAWPDPDWMDVSHVRKQIEQWEGKYAVLGGDWSPFWHDLIDLLDMEHLFYAMFDTPEVIESILSHATDFYAKVSERMFEEADDLIDIFFIGNDFGSQIGPLMGPPQFEEFVMPHLKRLIDLGHRYDLKVQMHCCGGIRELFPLLIDAGLDAIHAVQPDCVGMDLKELKTEFGDKIVFNGAVDSHHVLIEGDEELTRKSTKEVLDIMMPGGGFIAGASHDYVLDDTPVANIAAMFETVREYGTYQ